MAATKDFTQGSPARLLFLFALPLMFGNLFQQMYTMVDTIIVGQGVGVEALASLGAADWLNWLVLGLMTGIAQGFSILFSQFYGAGDEKRLQKSVGNALLITLAAAVLMVIIAECSVKPVLFLLQTPENILDGAVLYLRFMFGGIPVCLFYNLASAMLRSLGDGKTPLLAMICAAAVNVGLDLLFVMVFHWGIAGAAVATLIAQAVSLLYCARVIRRIPVLRLDRECLRPDAKIICRLLILGLPMMFQNTIIAVGGMFVQFVVNGFGFLFVAAFTAANKLYGILELAAISYGYAVTTFVAQNFGAKQFGRIRKGIHQGLLIALATSCVISVFMFLFGEEILSLFISTDPEQAALVLSISRRYLNIMSSFLMVLYALHVYRSGLQGIGDTIMPMVSGIMELCMRAAAALILPVYFGQDGIFYAEILAWTGATVVLVASYYVELRIRQRKLIFGNRE